MSRIKTTKFAMIAVPLAAATAATPLQDKTKRPDKAGTAKTNKDNLQGKWVFALVQINGREAPGPISRLYKSWTFKGDEQFLDFGHAPQSGSFKLSAGEIDILKNKGAPLAEGQTRLSKGVYKLEGDKLTICLSLPDQPRPSEFNTTTAKGGYSLWVLKPAGTDVRSDWEKLNGAWQFAAVEIDGKKLGDEVGRAYRRLLFRDDRRFDLEARALWGTFSLSAAKSPSEIDFTATHPGDAKGKPVVYQGIYKFDGESLTICQAKPGKPRPSEFNTTNAKGGQSLWILKRDATSQARRLDGEWKQVLPQGAGKPDRDGDLTWTVEGDQITIRSGAEVATATFKLGFVSSKETGIDITMLEGPALKSRTYQGVFKLDGDRLHVLYNTPGFQVRHDGTAGAGFRKANPLEGFTIVNVQRPSFEPRQNFGSGTGFVPVGGALTFVRVRK